MWALFCHDYQYTRSMGLSLSPCTIIVPYYQQITYLFLEPGCFLRRCDGLTAAFLEFHSRRPKKFCFQPPFSDRPLDQLNFLSSNYRAVLSCFKMARVRSLMLTAS